MEIVKKIFILLGSLDRRIIFLIVGLSVLIPLLKPDWVNLPIRPRPESQTVFNEINKLNEGDKIIAEGLTKVRPGMKVKPIIKSH